MESIQDYQKEQEQYQSIKPAIKIPLLLLNSLGITITIYIFLSWFFIGTLLSIFNISNITGIVLSAIIIFFIILFIVFLFKKTVLKRKEYKFYSNRVEYYDGFLVKNRKTINYDRITNIGQKKRIIEGWFGLGTIFIDTAGFSPKGHELSMEGLENTDQIYDWISNITIKKQ